MRLLLRARVQHQKSELTSRRLIWRMTTTWRLTLSHHFNLLSNLPLQGLRRPFQQLKRTHNTLWMHIGLSHQRSHLTVKLRLTTFSSDLSSAAQLHFRSWIIVFLLNFWLACKLCFYWICADWLILECLKATIVCLPWPLSFFHQTHCSRSEKCSKEGRRSLGQIWSQHTFVWWMVK